MKMNRAPHIVVPAQAGTHPRTLPHITWQRRTGVNPVSIFMWPSQGHGDSRAEPALLDTGRESTPWPHIYGDITVTWYNIARVQRAGWVYSP